MRLYLFTHTKYAARSTGAECPKAAFTMKDGRGSNCLDFAGSTSESCRVSASG